MSDIEDICGIIFVIVLANVLTLVIILGLACLVERLLEVLA